MLTDLGEESGGASFLRRNGSVLTTDKGRPVMDLLAAEITECTGEDPGEHCCELTLEFGASLYARIDASVTASIYKIYAESLKDQWHFDTILTGGGEIVSGALPVKGRA
jgi:phosphoglucomutase